MSPRTGRPKVDNPINIRTSVRLDKKTDDELNEYCIKNNLSKGEAIRKGVYLLLRKIK
ncbi:MAG: CopG family transcriptional regulator [Lachnospiraceae bacterium]|jgi:conserved domain protein|nr:MAG: CopG family transcriptional regulator [Lachnospiraceae bacterium]